MLRWIWFCHIGLRLRLTKKTPCSSLSRAKLHKMTDHPARLLLGAKDTILGCHLGARGVVISDGWASPVALFRNRTFSNYSVKRSEKKLGIRYRLTQVLIDVSSLVREWGAVKTQVLGTYFRCSPIGTDIPFSGTVPLSEITFPQGLDITHWHLLGDRIIVSSISTPLCPSVDIHPLSKEYFI